MTSAFMGRATTCAATRRAASRIAGCGRHRLEYRLRLPRLLGIGLTERLGLVGFGGVGWVGRQLSDMAFDDLLPGGGAGLRFRLTKKYPINFRIDYGIGRVGHTLSMGVGEAF
jgi:hypothetical protein